MNMFAVALVLAYMPAVDLALAVLIGATLAGIIVGAVQICIEELA